MNINIFFFVYLVTVGKPSVWRFPIPQLSMKKLKPFENIIQKYTFKNINSWFFQF